jgi:hypothetical protein
MTPVDLTSDRFQHRLDRHDRNSAALREFPVVVLSPR